MEVRSLVYQGWVLCAAMVAMVVVILIFGDGGRHVMVLCGVLLFAIGAVGGANLMHYRWLKVWGYWDRRP